jgi:hypothetical protein
MLRGRFAAIVLLATLTGCAPLAQHPRTYTALRTYGRNELSVGDDYRDFRFVDAVGRVTRLSAEKGRVTVLAFRADPRWPNCADVQALAELARQTSGPNSEVKVISIGRPMQPCADALAAGALCDAPPERIALVCDPYGTIPPLYDSAALGRFYVLTNYLKIAAIGDLGDLEGLRAAVSRVVAEIYDQDVREGMYEPNGPGRR